MAQMANLLEELSRLDGRPVETMHHVMKTLRTAGHVQPGKRGTTFPVETTDAANLLIACMSGAQPVDTPRAVDVYSSLRPRRKGGFGKGFPALDAVATADTFGAALATLLTVAPKMKAQAVLLLSLLFDKVPVDQLMSLEFFSLSLELQRPVPYAKLTLEAVNEAGFYSHEFSQEWRVDSSLFMRGFYKSEMRDPTDLRTQTSITHRTIFRLGDLLAAAEEKEQDYAEVARTEGASQPEGSDDAGAPVHSRERRAGSQRHRVPELRLPKGGSSFLG